MRKPCESLKIHAQVACVGSKGAHHGAKQTLHASIY